VPGESKSATVVFVVYRTTKLCLDWIPEAVPIIVVHNDRALDVKPMRQIGVRHVFAGHNVGFGSAVNLALPFVETERVLLCNPDMLLTREHWEALRSADASEIVTVPVREPDGTPTSMVNLYPTPLSLLLTGYRVGRLLRRDSRLRHTLALTLGRWGREHAHSLDLAAGMWSLHTHWVSGAVLSVDTTQMRAVGGFDPGYFLYLEDIDLCSRLARRFPGMRIRMAAVKLARHTVGGSATSTAARRLVDRHRLASIRRYAAGRPGLGWRLCRLALVPRSAWLSVRTAAP
jgi:N-acetylglucosaminyl-diphospho-decaprenol L-rhamnosyltransferase